MFWLVPPLPPSLTHVVGASGGGRPFTAGGRVQ